MNAKFLPRPGAEQTGPLIFEITLGKTGTIADKYCDEMASAFYNFDSHQLPLFVAFSHNYSLRLHSSEGAPNPES